jgi:hypothetical protein
MLKDYICKCSLVWRSQKRSSPDSAATIQSPSSFTMAAVTMAPYKTHNEIHFVTQSFDPATFCNIAHYEIDELCTFCFFSFYHPHSIFLNLLFLFPTSFVLHLSFSFFLSFLFPSYIQSSYLYPTFFRSLIFIFTPTIFLSCVFPFHSIFFIVPLLTIPYHASLCRSKKFFLTLNLVY